MATEAPLRSAPRAMMSALAAISPIVTGTKPAAIAMRQRALRKRSTTCDTAQARTQLGPHIATVATTAPGTPAIKCPSKATNMMLGPGAACATANNSLNWRSVSHCAISTVWRCISGTAEPPPPTAKNDKIANCRNSAARVAESFVIGAPPGKCDARRHDHQQHQGEAQTQHPDRHKCRDRHSVLRAQAKAKKRLGQLNDGRHNHPGCRGG